MNRRIPILFLAFFIAAPLCRADGLYSVYVFYKGYLTDSEKEIVKRLETESQKGFFEFKTANPSSSGFDWKDYAVWKLQDKKAALPRIVLRFPEPLKIKENAWAGPLSAENTSMLLASEKRDEIVRLLKKGASAVWIFTGSGQEKFDVPAEAMLRSALSDFAKSNTAKHKPSFPVITLMPEARGERILFSILGKVKGNHDGLKTPALIPVIGKGQVVSVLSGDRITRENILKLCTEIATVPASDEKIFLCLKWDGGALSASSGDAFGKGEAGSFSSPGTVASNSDSEKSFELGPPGDNLTFGAVSFQRYYSFLLIIPFLGIMALIVYAIAKSDKKRKP